MAINEIHPKHPSFAMILKERVVEQFFIRLDAVSHRAEELLIVSPVLGTLSGTRMTVERLRHLVRLNKIRTYLVTRSPENDLTRGAPGHRPALETLGSIDGLEIRYNDQLHAKVYVCMCNDRQSSFAVIGSANMTRSSIERNIEVGIMIRYAYQGQNLIDELGYWVKNELRLKAKMAKPIVIIRG
jgi:phosphatidylserine/phosphatidylglycerophosphate/cardiolipin synthase-like enzyme